jgi:hypothetical protein
MELKIRIVAQRENVRESLEKLRNAILIDTTTENIHSMIPY